MLDTLIAHRPVTVKTADWVKMSIEKLATMLGVAEAALNSAKEYAAKQRHDTSLELWLDLAMLAAAAAVMVGMMVMVSRRVTGPLRNIQQAMLKVAGGDFSVVLPGLERKDEIGDVANAVERFKVLADEKARAEAAEAVKRQQVEADRVAQITQTEAAAQAKVAEERAKIAEEQTQAVKALGVGLVRLSEGDLTFRLTAGVPGGLPGAQGQLQRHDGAAAGDGPLADRIGARGDQRLGRDLDQHHRSVAAHRGTGGQPGRDLRLDGRDRRHGEEERRERAAGQCLGRRHPRRRRPRRPGGGQGGRRHGQDRGLLAQDLRHHRRHRRDRPPDQPLGAQRRGGSGPRRRGRPRLCGRRLRGAQPGAALLASRQGHQGPDHQQQWPGQGWRRTGQPGGGFAHRDRRIDQEGGRHRRRHRQCQRRAGERHRAGQQGAHPDGRGDAAELGAGRGERRHRQDAGAPSQGDGRAGVVLQARGTAEERQAAQPAAARAQRPAAAAPSRGPAAKQQPVAAPKRAASSNAGGPVRRMQTALATAIKSEPDWKEF